VGEVNREFGTPAVQSIWRTNSLSSKMLVAPYERGTEVCGSALDAKIGPSTFVGTFQDLSRAPIATAIGIEEQIATTQRVTTIFPNWPLSSR
jgi:hypothetical protein